MIEQKRRGVDEGPGQILGGGEALIFELDGAEVGIFAETLQRGVQRHRKSGGSDRGFAGGELRVLGQRLAGSGQIGGHPGALCIVGFEVVGEDGLLIRGALGSGDGEDGPYIGRQSQDQWARLTRDTQTEPGHGMLAVHIVLMQADS